MLPAEVPKRIPAPEIFQRRTFKEGKRKGEAHFCKSMSGRRLCVHCHKMRKGELVEEYTIYRHHQESNVGIHGTEPLSSLSETCDIGTGLLRTDKARLETIGRFSLDWVYNNNLPLLPLRKRPSLHTRRFLRHHMRWNVSQTADSIASSNQQAK